MAKTQNTQYLVDDFRNQLLNRIEDLHQTLDCLSNSNPAIIERINKEIDRIGEIFKFMENEKNVSQNN